jgi:transposase
MFPRIKKVGPYRYLQIVENRREGTKTKQRVIATLGRLEALQEKGEIAHLVHSLAKFSKHILIVLSNRSEDIKARGKRIGPSLICERLWEELRIGTILRALPRNRKYGFDVERAIFLTVLHRLFVSGSDRACDRWRREYVIRGSDGIELHHVYRAMAWIGEELEDQTGRLPFTPRCMKDRIEEELFFANRTLFTGLDFVCLDTTSLYFEGNGGESIGMKGNTKDHRPDLNQMVVGVALDDTGMPLCCEMWPGNTADVTALLPVVDRIRTRFDVGRFCIVADRGMISAKTMEALEHPERHIPYILGARMRKVTEIREEVLSRAGRYTEVYPEGKSKKDPHPLKVKEVKLGTHRYIVCVNSKEARKDAATREAIIESLKVKLAQNAKSLIGNKGYRKYLKMERDSVCIDQEKINTEARFDGKWVLKTNTDLSPREVALKYKQLWEVEHAFRDLKAILNTRPIFHKKDATIRGHVFCSFLALVLLKELYRRLSTRGYCFEWEHIKQDLNALQELILEEKGKSLAVRSECVGTCGNVFKAVGVAIPPTIKAV